MTEAYIRFARRGPPSRLLVVGDGPERPLLERMVAAAGYGDRLECVGAVSHHHVPEQLARMHVGLAPYPELEPFYFSPLKVFEYMAGGAAVVASDVGQISSLIDHGENGLLCPPEDTQTLSEELFRLAADESLRHRLAVAGRTFVERHHTWRHRMQELFQTLPWTSHADVVEVSGR